MTSLIRRAIAVFGYDLVAKRACVDIEADACFMRIYNSCCAYTATSKERLYATYFSTCHIIQNEIPGAFAECGVWRGGNIMAMALTLIELGVKDRPIYLYDTFTGMPQPGEKDVDFRNRNAWGQWGDIYRQTTAELEEVKRNVFSTGYENFVFVSGRVEDTIPGRVPDRIALLRLDTDWYESTRHELIHLYPRVTEGGVLIVDDYGHWRGCKQAVDEYFQENDIHTFLHRIDYTGRIAIKAPSAPKRPPAR